MSTSSNKDTATTNKTDPWAPQAGALTTAFDAAGNALNTAQGATAPTDFTAQMTPAQLATFQQMIQQGGNTAIPDQQAATGSALQTAGTSGVQGALSGLSNYNAAGTNNADTTTSAAQKYVAGQDIPAQVRQAMQGATETARDITMPGIEQNAAIGGNTNSSRTGVAQGIVQRGLAENAANMTGSLSSQAYANALALAEKQQSENNTQNLGALSTAGQVGNTAAATGVGAGTASVANQNSLDSTAMAGGAGQQEAEQAKLDNAQQQYQSKISSPFDALKQYMGIVGTNNWGSNSSGTSNTTSTPSAWDTISGLMSSGGKAASGAAALAPFLMSDRRIKEDITRIGTLDNGLPLYTFRYIGCERLNVGLMAQDVELVNPAAVRDFHGIKMVNYALACA
jgi:hypothetical protein